MKAKTGLKASNLRFILVSILVIASIGLIIGFYFIQNYLKTNSLKSIYNSSSVLVSRQINEARDDLTNLGDKKINILESTYRQEDWQTQIKKDIDHLASLSGVSIKDITFVDQASEQIVIENKTKAPTFYNQQATINFNNPTAIESFLKFVKLLEQNLPIIRISELKIAKFENSMNNVNAESLKIGVIARHE